MGRTSDRTELERVATSPEALVRRLLGTDVVMLLTYRGTDLWVPATDALEPDAVTRWLARTENGVVSAIDLWALRRGLTTEIGTRGLEAEDPDSNAITRRLEGARSALVAAAREFVDALPYASVTAPMTVDYAWVEAELHAILVSNMVERLPSYLHTAIANPTLLRADLRMRELWAPTSGPPSRTGTGRESTRRFTRACMRASVPTPTHAAAIAALEALNPHAYDFSSTSAGVGAPRRWSSAFIAERFDTIRMTWKTTGDTTGPAETWRRAKRAFIATTVDPADVTPEGRARRIHERFFAPVSDEPRTVRIFAPVVEGDGDLDLDLSGLSVYASADSDEDEVRSGDHSLPSSDTDEFPHE